MNVLRAAVLLLTLALAASRADDTNLTLTVDGVIYSNVTFGTVTPSTVVIRHSTGAATLPLEKLPSELQARFSYDPKAAENFRQQQAEWQEYQRDTRGKAIVNGQTVVLTNLDAITLEGWIAQKGVIESPDHDQVRGTLLDLGLGRGRVLVVDWVAPQPLGQTCQVTAYRVLPRGYETYAVAQTIPFDSWKKMKGQ